MNPLSGNKTKSFSKNFFIDLNDPASKHFAHTLFKRIQNNYRSTKDHPQKIVNNMFQTNNNFSSRGKIQPKESFCISPNHQKQNSNSQKTMSTSKMRRTNSRQIKSIDFFNELDKIEGLNLNSINKPPEKSKTNQSEIQLSQRLLRSKSFKKDDFLKTISNCLEFKDKGSYIIEILENKEDEIKINKAIQTDSFNEFHSLLKLKFSKNQQLYSENFETFSQLDDENKNFKLDLMKILFKDLTKIANYYEFFFKKFMSNVTENNQKPKIHKNESELSNFFSALEILLKIHSPYNNENNIHIEEIKENYINEYKSIMKRMMFDLESEIFQKTLVKLDSHLKYYDEIMEKCLKKNENLNLEVQSMQKILKENIIIENKFTKNLLEKNHRSSTISLEEKDTSLTIIQKYNDIMIKNIKKLEDEKSDLEQQLINAQKTSFSLETRMKVLLKKNKKKLCANKETQTSHFIEPKKMFPNKTNIYSNLITKSVVYYKYRDDDLLGMVNLIFSDKLIFDNKTIKKTNKIVSLNEYLNKWFILKISNSEICNLMLRDFLLNLKENENKNTRYQIFLNLLGLTKNENYIPENLKDSSIPIDFKLVFYSSPYSCKLFLQTAHFMRYSQIFDDQDPYLSLLPNANPDLDLQKIKNLEIVLKEVLSQENLESDIIDDFLFNFHKLCGKLKLNNQGSSSSLSPSGRISISLTSQRRGSALQSDPLMKYDDFMSFFLESFAQLFQKKMEHFLILLKLIENSRNIGRIFIEDFKGMIGKVFPTICNFKKESLYLKFTEMKYELQIDNFNFIAAQLAEEILEGIYYGKNYIIEKKNLNSETILKQENKISKMQDIMVFSHIEKESSKETNFYLNQNNPENYKIWNILNQNQDDFDIKFYDVVNSIGFINFIYDYIREILSKMEDKNDALYTYHEIWKKEFYRLPPYQSLKNLKKYNFIFSGWDRVDLINKIQMNLNLIRLITDSMILKKEKS